MARTNQINKFILEVDLKKATGPNKIPPKIMKISANVIDSDLTNIINSDIEKKSFSEDARIASVRPIFRKNKCDTEKNYRLVSILNCLLKIYDRYNLEQFKQFIK